MKTIFSFLLVGLISLEIVSPFMIGYLNNNQRIKSKHSSPASSFIKANSKTRIADNTGKKTKQDLNMSENSYSDSKSLSIKEKEPAFNHDINP